MFFCLKANTVSLPEMFFMVEIFLFCWMLNDLFQSMYNTSLYCVSTVCSRKVPLCLLPWCPCCRGSFWKSRKVLNILPAADLLPCVLRTWVWNASHWPHYTHHIIYMFIYSTLTYALYYPLKPLGAGITKFCVYIGSTYTNMK